MTRPVGPAADYVTMRVARWVMADTRRSWRSDAACRGLPTAMFFPDPDRPDGDAGAEAQTVCDSCPVREACVEAGALEPTGIWGGLSPDERRDRRVTTRPAA